MHSGIVISIKISSLIPTILKFGVQPPLQRLNKEVRHSSALCFLDYDSQRHKNLQWLFRYKFDTPNVFPPAKQSLYNVYASIHAKTPIDDLSDLIGFDGFCLVQCNAWYPSKKKARLWSNRHPHRRATVPSDPKKVPKIPWAVATTCSRYDSTTRRESGGVNTHISYIVLLW